MDVIEVVPAEAATHMAAKNSAVRSVILELALIKAELLKSTKLFGQPSHYVRVGSRNVRDMNGPIHWHGVTQTVVGMEPEWNKIHTKKLPWDTLLIMEVYCGKCSPYWSRTAVCTPKLDSFIVK